MFVYLSWPWYAHSPDTNLERPELLSIRRLDQTWNTVLWWVLGKTSVARWEKACSRRQWRMRLWQRFRENVLYKHIYTEKNVISLKVFFFKKKKKIVYSSFLLPPFLKQRYGNLKIQLKCESGRFQLHKVVESFQIIILTP